jgi:hypothetical protein
MAVISRRIFRPIPGRVAEANSRIKRLSEALTRAGARVRLCAVAWGDGARDLHLNGVFPSVKAGAEAFTALGIDADAVKLRAESESNPSSVWEGPEVWRTVFGEPQPNYPVMLQREYQMDRRNLKKAVALMPEIQALRPDRPVIAVVPVVSGDMARFMALYYANSLVDLGEGIDEVGFSDAFQSIVVRAAELGALTKARVLVNV